MGFPDSPDTIDIIVIGAGFSGICALIRLRERFPHATTQIFEKAGGIGGTWLKNSYPGLSCDIPSQLYSYSFAPSADWSSVYATQPEILAYIRRVVDEYDCWKHIQVHQECQLAEWSTEQCLWRVKFLNHDTGKFHVKHCRVLITAVGIADVPKGHDDIRGIDSFSGKIFHSAAWDHTFDFKDTNVVVVGNGCSANQFVPWLVSKGDVRSVVQVVRSAHWIAPKDDSLASARHKWLMATFPFLNRLSRLWLAFKFDLVFQAFKKSFIGRVFRRSVEHMITAYMRQTAPAQYHSILIPTFPFGAKRTVMDHGYLEALHDVRMKLFKSHALEVIAPDRIRVGSGEQLPANVIILANGFETQQIVPMTIQGVYGARLPDLWQQGSQAAAAYMGVSVANFPNLFLLTGPNTLPSGHSTLIGIECSVAYILGLLDRVIRRQPSKQCITVSEDAQVAYNRWVKHKLEGMVYTSEVRNWYTDQRTGQNTLIWPGSQFEFWWSRCVKPIRWEDFEKP